MLEDGPYREGFHCRDCEESKVKEASSRDYRSFTNAIPTVLGGIGILATIVTVWNCQLGSASRPIPNGRRLVASDTVLGGGYMQTTNGVSSFMACPAGSLAGFVDGGQPGCVFADRSPLGLCDGGMTCLLDKDCATRLRCPTFDQSVNGRPTVVVQNNGNR